MVIIYMALRHLITSQFSDIRDIDHLWSLLHSVYQQLLV